MKSDADTMSGMRLHIGSGPLALPGWVNVDRIAYPGVDAVFDIRQPWPFHDVELIFAEHFIEHLALADGLEFLKACRTALTADGVLRLSTPNLDWVWLTHYKPPPDLRDDERLTGCLEINRAFHGWGHQFLYNGALLECGLRAAGFARVTHCVYGESSVPALRGLERHERHFDVPGAPSVVIVEASGAAAGDLDGFAERIAPYVRDFSAS